eukprot:5030867-Amphidinium_carterae.1
MPARADSLPYPVTVWAQQSGTWLCPPPYHPPYGSYYPPGPPGYPEPPPYQRRPQSKVLHFDLSSKTSKCDACVQFVGARPGMSCMVSCQLQKECKMKT